MKSKTREILKELRVISRSLEKIAGAFSVSAEPALIDRFRAFKGYSKNGMFGLKGIRNPDPVTFGQLIGIDGIIASLNRNTEQFLLGLPCNNVLLYGPRGTGKSSVIKATLNRYSRRGLKMIEMQRDTLGHILDLADIIRERSEKFIVFCDDLSFEENEQSYRPVRTILEGGLETRPANILVYATSNRRHLLPEKAQENLPSSAGGELHPEEAREEKLALSDRFGLRLGLQYFDKETYLNIIANYAKSRRIRINRGDLMTAALQWSLEQGSFSGRTARQYIDSLEGGMKLVRKAACSKSRKR